MRRRDFVTLFGASAAAWPLVARAQQRTMPVIGYFSSSTSDGYYADYLRAFRQGLKESGYVEGENAAIEYRWGDNEPDRLPVLSAELVRRRVNVIALISAPASLAVAKATNTIPTVFMVPEDPVKLGLVTSLSHQVATGRASISSRQAAAKRLELLCTMVVPAATTWLCPQSGRTDDICGQPPRCGGGGQHHGIATRRFQCQHDRQIDTGGGSQKPEPDALLISSGPFFSNRRVQLAHLCDAIRHPCHGWEPCLPRSWRPDGLRNKSG